MNESLGRLWTFPPPLKYHEHTQDHSKMSSTPTHISIIGCGLAGLTMALMLDHSGISSFDIYERHDSTSAHAIGGAISLCPNSLRLLDELGIYAQLKDKAVQQTQGLILDENLQVKSMTSWGDEEMYGYKALRISREVVIEEMKSLLKQRGLFQKIHWQAKFVRIIHESDSEAEFELEDGTRHITNLLIGADGVHSKVRTNYIAPNTSATYAGCFMALSYIPTSALRFPTPEMDLAYRYVPVTIQTPIGGFNYVAQGQAGKECFCLRQFHYPEQDPSGWKNLNEDKSKLLKMFRQDYDAFPDLVKSAMDASTESGMSIWPIYTIPKLEKGWTSPKGRVVLIGDAAHAIPPAAGQGVNMAIEDAYTLGVLLKQCVSADHDIETGRALVQWQSWRQERVERVRLYATQLSMARMSAEERERHAAGLGKIPDGAKGELKWLFVPEPSLREQAGTLVSKAKTNGI